LIKLGKIAMTEVEQDDEVYAEVFGTDGDFE